MNPTNLPQAESETLWVIRDRVRFLGTVSEFALLEITVPPGSGTPPHRHESPEIFHILRGAITFGTFDEMPPSFTTVTAGGSLTVHSRRTHNYQNNSNETASMLVVLNHQMVKFFQDIGKKEPPPSGPPTPAEISEVIATCQKHGIEILDIPRS